MSVSFPDLTLCLCAANAPNGYGIKLGRAKLLSLCLFFGLDPLPCRGSVHGRSTDKHIKFAPALP